MPAPPSNSARVAARARDHITHTFGSERKVAIVRNKTVCCATSFSWPNSFRPSFHGRMDFSGGARGHSTTPSQDDSLAILISTAYCLLTWRGIKLDWWAGM